MGIPSDRVTLFFLRMVLTVTPDGLSTLAYRPWQGSGWFCPVHPKGAGRFVLRRSSGRLDRPKQKTAPALCRSRCRASVRYERWAHWFSAAWYSGWNKESPMLWPDGNTSSRGNGISPESAREHQILPRYVPPACRKNLYGVLGADAGDPAGQPAGDRPKSILRLQKADLGQSPGGSDEGWPGSVPEYRTDLSGSSGRFEDH